MTTAQRGHAPVFFGRPEEENGTRVALTDLHPQLANNNGASGLMVEPFQWSALGKHNVDLVFLATPHEQSRAWVPKLLEHGVRIIDLSGAWRLDEATNRAIYKLEDQDPDAAHAIQQKAVYGLPELHRDQIASAHLIANPGCYSTSIILALAPLIKEKRIDVAHGIICDSKSGVSGAGKTPTAKTHFMNTADNLSAYSVRWSGTRLPEIQYCVRTSYCDLGFALARDGKRLIVVSCLDNLLKGASSQAVQNMNLLFGWPEQEGLA